MFFTLHDLILLGLNFLWQNLYFYASENNEEFRRHMLVETLLIPRLVLPYLDRYVRSSFFYICFLSPHFFSRFLNVCTLFMWCHFFNCIHVFLCCWCNCNFIVTLVAHTNTHTDTHTHTHTRIHTYTHTHVYKYIYAHIFT